MEDERQVEMECIAAIFPEILFGHKNPFSATIELPVHPTSSVKVIFPTSADGLLPTPPRSATSGQEDNQPTVRLANNVESHNLSYLPSLELRITLPEGYPEEKPASFQLSTTPEWLSRSYLDELQEHGEQMWEECGRSLVVYGYIDFLQQAAENAFGFSEKGKILEIPQDFKISLLDYDIKASQAAFDKETFDCGVCLDPKKGSACHRMIDCGHVFCVQCLQEFYNNAITEGDLATVRCLAPDCAKKRAEARGPTKKGRKSKIQLSPSELLQIPLDHEIVARYVKLKHKAELESDKNTVYCPRKWCQGAARSKKHRKPDGFEDTANSDEDSDNEDGKTKKFVAGRDLLAVCEDCSFAFCSRCYQGWHGEFISCAPKTNTGELTEEDKASLEYMKLHTTPCPTCAAPAQKTHGCNHMICFKCNSHFCYLCSAWLSPTNPYKHYNEEKTSCYMRLWELEQGDGDDVGIGYAGGVRPVEIPQDPEERDVEIAAAADLEVLRDVPEIIEPDEPDDPQEPRPEIQREGPLVLRINQPIPPPAPAVPDPPPADNRRNRVAQRQQQQNGRGNAAPARGRVMFRRREPAGRQQARDALAQNAAEQEEANQRWVQMFVQMALNDEEDQLDSDDEDDPAAWEIPVR
ncbi:hypothetical protein EG329_001935 [Mollisiaceae sp. DMI_Dod_QoI]|nr:hypothetical protein EG329_001935 [Helotiales sp. DMI_Dod_QoI]